MCPRNLRRAVSRERVNKCGFSRKGVKITKISKNNKERAKRRGRKVFDIIIFKSSEF